MNKLNVGDILTVVILALLVYDVGWKVLTQDYQNAVFTLCVLVVYVGLEALRGKRGY